MANQILHAALFINKMNYNGKIYKITNLANGKIYIGRTKHSINERLRQHVKDRRAKTAIGSAILKYGIQNFTIEQIDTASNIEEAMQKEKMWIKNFDSRNREIGYNILEGGNDFKNVAKELVKIRNYYIKCDQTGETFESYVNAAQAFGVSADVISESVRDGIVVRGAYTWSKIPKQENRLTGALNIKKETRFAGRRRIKCVETGEIFESAECLSKRLNVSYTWIRRIIKNTKKYDGFSYEFIDKALNRNPKNASKKISQQIKRQEDGKIFSSGAAMAKELGFSTNYSYYIMKKLNGIHNNLHYAFI